MRKLNSILENRELNMNALTKFGFKKDQENEGYFYSENILDNQFEVQISINKDNAISKLIDKACDEEYVLVDVLESKGEFVGKVRSEYEGIINNFIRDCTSYNLYKEEQVKDIMEYINEKYGEKPEFLWDDENGIIRNSKNKKWFIIFMKILPEKIGLNGMEKIEIIDIRYQKDETEKVIDYKSIFPGYHMNKKSWITILVNESLKNEELFELIDNSYQLSLNR